MKILKISTFLFYFFSLGLSGMTELEIATEKNSKMLSNLLYSKGYGDPVLFTPDILPESDFIINLQKKILLISVGANEEHFIRYKLLLPQLTSLGIVESSNNFGYGPLIFGQDKQSVEERKVTVLEKIYFPSERTLFFYKKEILNRGSCVRFVFSSKTKEELTISSSLNQTWREYLDRLLDSKNIKKEISAKENIRVEIHLDVSKTKRQVVCFYISEKDLPKNFSFFNDF